MVIVTCIQGHHYSNIMLCVELIKKDKMVSLTTITSPCDYCCKYQTFFSHIAGLWLFIAYKESHPGKYDSSDEVHDQCSACSIGRENPRDHGSR